MSYIPRAASDTVQPAPTYWVVLWKSNTGLCCSQPFSTRDKALRHLGVLVTHGGGYCGSVEPVCMGRLDKEEP